MVIYQGSIFIGCCVRVNAIKAVIHKLSKLKIVLEGLIGYRFHSSSLLLIYDGHQADLHLKSTCENPSHKKLMLRFAKSGKKQENTSEILD